jgi:hypothetical protein
MKGSVEMVATIEYVPSNTTRVLHIRRSGDRMYCGQGFSNQTVDRDSYSHYRVCQRCESLRRNEQVNPEEAVQARPAVEVEVVRNEEPADHWEANGFLPDIARICNDLEGERERFLLTSDLRQIIETINNAQTVQDFSRYNDSQLNDFKHQIQRRLPEVERQVVGFVNQITRARTVAVESIDFI